MTSEFVLWYDLQSEKHDGRVSSKPREDLVQRRSRNCHMMRNHQHSKKIYFRIIFWWLLLALEPLIQESGDPPDTRSPTQPPPKSRLSEIKLNFHKTRLPCLSSWLLQASAKIGLITLPRTLNDDMTFKERDVPQVTILAKEGRRWYGSPEVLSPQPVGNSRALLVVHKS